MDKRWQREHRCTERKYGNCKSDQPKVHRSYHTVHMRIGQSGENATKRPLSPSLELLMPGAHYEICKIDFRQSFCRSDPHYENAGIKFYLVESWNFVEILDIPEIVPRQIRPVKVLRQTCYSPWTHLKNHPVHKGYAIYFAVQVEVVGTGKKEGDIVHNIYFDL